MLYYIGRKISLIWTDKELCLFRDLKITKEQPSQSCNLKAENGIIRRNRVHITPTAPSPSDSGPISQKMESSIDVEIVPIIIHSRPPMKEITATADRQEPSTLIILHGSSTTITLSIPTAPIPKPKLTGSPTMSVECKKDWKTMYCMD